MRRKDRQMPEEFALAVIDKCSFAQVAMTDEKGNPHYIFENGTDLQELDGICLYAGQEQNPDYKIISIKPYRFLILEVERI